MAVARLFIREIGKSDLVQNNGDYDSAEAAGKDGERMCVIGTISYFEVWERAGAYQARITIEALDEAPDRRVA